MILKDYHKFLEEQTVRYSISTRYNIHNQVIFNETRHMATAVCYGQKTAKQICAYFVCFIFFFIKSSIIDGYLKCSNYSRTIPFSSLLTITYDMAVPLRPKSFRNLFCKPCTMLDYLEIYIGVVNHCGAVQVDAPFLRANMHNA